FDNLDKDAQKDLKTTLDAISKNTFIIQLISRKEDILPFISQEMILEGSTIRRLASGPQLNKGDDPTIASNFAGSIPMPIIAEDYKGSTLIECKEISVTYGDKKVLDKINWTIKKGEFWQLIGPNGSGKS